MCIPFSCDNNVRYNEIYLQYVNYNLLVHILLSYHLSYVLVTVLYTRILFTQGKVIVKIRYLTTYCHNSVSHHKNIIYTSKSHCENNIFRDYFHKKVNMEL